MSVVSETILNQNEALSFMRLDSWGKGTLSRLMLMVPAPTCKA